MSECREYIKGALSEVNSDNEFKLAVVNCLEFMADKVDARAEDAKTLHALAESVSEKK